MVEETQAWSEMSTDKEPKYNNLVYAIVDYLKKEKDYEGTNAVASPSEILDRIYGLAQGLPDVKERILS